MATIWRPRRADRRCGRAAGAYRRWLRTFAQEFGVGHHGEIGLGMRLPDDPLDLVPRAHGNGRFRDDHRITGQRGGNLTGGGVDERQVGEPVATARRSADGNKDGLGAGHRLRQIRREGQSALADVSRPRGPQGRARRWACVRLRVPRSWRDRYRRTRCGVRNRRGRRRKPVRHSLSRPSRCASPLLSVRDSKASPAVDPSRCLLTTRGRGTTTLFASCRSQASR